MSFIEKQLNKLMVELNKRLIELKRLVSLKADRKEEITQNGETKKWKTGKQYKRHKG